MKILFVHNFYQQFGGEDSAAIAERALLEAQGHQILAYTRHNDEIKQYGIWDKLRFAQNTFFSFRTQQELRAAVSSFCPDAAFVHNVYPLISPSLYHTLHQLKVPIVQVVHDFRPYCANGWFFTNGQICERCKIGNHLHGIANRCYKDSYVLSALYSATLGINRAAGITGKIDAFICLTEFYKRKLLEVGVPERKIYIRPNFIDRDYLASPPCPGKGQYVLYLGRLSPEKGPWTVVKAFERLRHLQLRIVGTGPLEAELRQYISVNRLDNIRLLGFKTGREKADLVRGCLLAVVPSECYENFPTVILEFFSAGKPVIASKLGGLPHIVEDGKNGVLFSPADSSDLAEKVSSLIARPKELITMGIYGRHLAETRYSPEESHRTLMAIFRNVQPQ